MRLTLRTLLAYLDDTLTPTETKQIGQKVAESDAAQELIARIKQVTRRRRLASPPATGPNAKWDANLVASYLDNDSSLSPEEVAEIEKQCLESDAHLAEVSGVHQILTLAHGEQVLVPPTARERMYGLVRGREAVRRRKAPPAATRRSAQEVLRDGAGPVDDPLLMGLPQYRRSSWLQWFLPAVALLLLVGLCFAIYTVVHNLGMEDTTVVNRGTGREGDGNRSALNLEESKPETAHLAPVSQVQVAQGFAEFLDKANAAAAAASPSTTPGTGTSGATPEPEKGPWFDTPSTKRAPVGRVGDAQRGLPFLLVSRQTNAPGEMWEGWERAAPGARLFSSDALVAPPGCRTELQLEKKVDVYLWGNIAPQFLRHLPLYDCGVVVNNPSDRYDLDLTLQRGRIILTNRKDKAPARVRLRFYHEEDRKVQRDGKEEVEPGRKEVWDLTMLEPDTEIGLERVSLYTSDIGYGSGIGPQCDLYLVVLKGRATVNVDEFRFWNLEAPPGPALLEWNNVGLGTQQPRRVRKESLEFWNKALPTTPSAKAMRDALDDVLRNVIEKKTNVDVAAHQAIDGPQPAGQVLGVHMLGSVDDLAGLMDALADPRDDHADVRNIAVVALRLWIGRNDANDRILYEALLKKRYTKGEARTILELLHGIPEPDQRLPHVWEELISRLKSPKVEIRQLAELKLAELVPQGRHIPFNPAGDTAQVEAAYRAWKEIIPDGKLPPPPPQAGAGGAPAPMPPKGP